jgi:hypothetical protein
MRLRASRRNRGTISAFSNFSRNTKNGRSKMLKTTLYSAVAGGLLAAATVATPVIAAPAAKATPQVEKNATGVQYYHYHRYHRHHRRHHHHDHGYYYYGPQYYNPGVGIYVRPW